MAIDINDLKLYKAYLNIIENKFLNKYFEQQKPFIHCKKGCAHCCKTGQYPLSELELEYMLIGYSTLPYSSQMAVREKIDEIKKNAQQFDNKEDFLYECPFLIDNTCSIYNFRPIICRTYGLMFTSDTGNKIPYCANLGLNYSEVYDQETKKISLAMWEKLGIKTEPLAYNLSMKTLISKELTGELGFEFNEIKPLIDWF